MRPKAIRNREDYKGMSEWISVTKMLPNDRQWVLASDSQDVHIVQFFKIPGTDDGYFEYHSIFEFKRDKITHWMPLPPTPKEES